MSLGLSERFNILQKSPHDFELPEMPTRAEESVKARWIPSRYNVRAVTKDGRLVLWNSYKGTMSVFSAEQAATVEALLTRKGVEARPKGIAKYLLDRGFLVKDGTNEYRRIQLGFGQQHYRTDTLQLILLASEDCNLRCQYCYEDFSRGTMKAWVRNGIKNLVQRRLPTLRSLSVSWFGGEPLYGLEAIEDLAPFFAETALQNSLRFTSNMTTNGYLLKPAVARSLLSWGVNRFQITLDGPPEDHDRNRPARDGGGTFAVIFDNLKHFRSIDALFSVDLRINFDRDNSPHLTNLLEMLELEFRGDDRFKLRLRPVGKWGGANDAALNVCGTDEAARIQIEMKAEARKRGLSLSDDIRHVQGMGGQVCYAARPYNFIVGASGKLMKCTIDLDKQDRNVVGEITEDGELKLDQDKFALWTEPAFEHDSKCQKCVVLPACQGVFCPQVRFDTGYSPCTPLRLGAKKELLEAASSIGSGGKKVIIQQDPDTLSA